MKNVRFSNFDIIDQNLFKEPLFENIVFGYEILFSQQIKAYEDSLEKIKSLDKALEKTIKDFKN
jgi:hypothetical protein